MLSDVGFSARLNAFPAKISTEKNAKTVHRFRLDHKSTDISLNHDTQTLLKAVGINEKHYVSGRCFAVIRLNC